MVVLGQRACIRAKWLYSDIVVAFGENCYSRVKWLFLGKLVSIRAKWLI